MGTEARNIVLIMMEEVMDLGNDMEARLASKVKTWPEGNARHHRFLQSNPCPILVSDVRLCQLAFCPKTIKNVDSGV